jgi:hypothetical protein
MYWDKPYKADYTLIRYSDVGYPATRTSGEFGAYTTATSYNQDGLTQNTTYYFSAWSYNTTYDYWSHNASHAYNTTLRDWFYFTNMSPYDGEINVSVYPNLSLNVTTNWGVPFDLVWYIEVQDTYEVLATMTNLNNGSYNVSLISYNDTRFGYYAWNYSWYVVATQTTNSSRTTTSEEFYYWTEGFTFVGNVIKMNELMIIIWLAVWALLMGIHLKTKSTTFGLFAGFWILLFGLLIIVSGIQLMDGTIETLTNPGTTVIQPQYTDAVTEYSSYAMLWGLPFLLLSIYIVYANLLARRNAPG